MKRREVRRLLHYCPESYSQVGESMVEDTTRNEDSKTLHSIEASADILQKSHWTIRWRVKHGHMRPVRVGRRLFFETAELLRVLETQKRK